MDAPGATALLDAEVAELCALPYSYWQTALNTTYEKHVTELVPGRRTYRLTVSVIERMSPAGPSGGPGRAVRERLVGRRVSQRHRVSRSHRPDPASRSATVWVCGFKPMWTI